MPSGQKHLVRCRCVLPQFKHANPPKPHQFIVFSVIDDDGSFRVKFAQCTNCGIVHRVTEVCRSEIVQGRETMGSIISIADIKASLPAQLVQILENNQADLPSWEAAQFIHEHKQWGGFVVLTSDVEGTLKQGKYVVILGERLFKVETYARDEVIK